MIRNNRENLICLLRLKTHWKIFDSYQINVLKWDLKAIWEFSIPCAFFLLTLSQYMKFMPHHEIKKAKNLATCKPCGIKTSFRSLHTGYATCSDQNLRQKQRITNLGKRSDSSLRKGKKVDSHVANIVLKYSRTYQPSNTKYWVKIRQHHVTGISSISSWCKPYD